MAFAMAYFNSPFVKKMPRFSARKIRASIELTSQLISQELHARYRGTSLGFGWTLLSAMGLLFVYTIVFTEIFPAQGFAPRPGKASAADYALVLLAGLIPFWTFNEILHRAPNLIASYPDYVRSIAFPTIVLPIAATGVALLTGFANLGVLIVAKFVFTGEPPANLLVLMFLMPLLAILCLSAGWILAAVGIYWRDTSQIVSVIGQFLFFVSPVFYPLSAAPEWLQEILLFNPLTVIIEGIRYAVMGTTAPSVVVFLTWAASLIFMAIASILLFKRLEPGFSGNV